jgi:predicted AAA+ superfamily ATPase
VMLYHDIIERYKIKDTTLLKYFVKHLVQTTTKEFSINKIGNTLKTLWLKFDKNSLYDFVDYLDTIYFGKSLSKFNYALSKQTLKKFYLFDNGYLNAISFNFSENYWKLLENAVFIELYRRYNNNLFFLKNWTETDFVVHLQDNTIYQVCYMLTEENRKREYAWCTDAMKKFDKWYAYIITHEQEEIIQIEQGIIYIIPFYKWIIEKSIS